VHGWNDSGDLHRVLAAAVPEQIEPHLLAFTGDEPLVVVRLRPFPRGGHEDAVIEALALAIPLGADRISLGMPARVWSLADPVPPVTEDADLRQRVLVETRVDGHDRPTPAVETLLHPFEIGGRTIAWSDPVDPGPGEGWTTGALAVIVEHRDEIGPRIGDWTVLDQVARLDALGHGVSVSPHGARRLAACLPDVATP
jgi:hypothetical protein